MLSSRKNAPHTPFGSRDLTVFVAQAFAGPFDEPGDDGSGGRGGGGRRGGGRRGGGRRPVPRRRERSGGSEEDYGEEEGEAVEEENLWIIPGTNPPKIQISVPSVQKFEVSTDLRDEQLSFFAWLGSRRRCLSEPVPIHFLVLQLY